MICDKCGSIIIETIFDQVVFKSIHYGERKCSNTTCNKHFGYVKKPDNLEKRGKNKYSPEDLGIDYCEICLRDKSMLGKNEVLIVHHKKELNSKIDKLKGEDVKENCLVVCTFCHQMIHYFRTYLFHHFTKEL